MSRIILRTAVLLSVFFGWLPSSVVFSQGLDPYRRSANLDPRGHFFLEWRVDWKERRVFFKATVKTLGYVGFGLARRGGKMAGADIVIGGVRPNGNSYFSDRYAVGNQLPEVDPTSQDWKLHSASQNGTHTFLSFSRLFDTCDVDHDLPISDDLATLIWAYGEVDDEAQYHFQNRGSYVVYLLDPDLSPDLPEFRRLEQPAKKKMKRFPMRAVLPLPQYDTMYWCHFFRVPTTTKHHMIGFSTELPTESDREHVHHLMLHRCRAPPGVDPVSLFGPAARSSGAECFRHTVPTNRLPTHYCETVIHPWGRGGRPIFFPDHAGMTMSEGGIEYFMMQVHYDNPDLKPNNTITVTLNAYYTADLRENEVSTIPLGEVIPSPTSIVIPPNSLNHQIHGYCPSECLQRMLPPDGVNVFAGFVHTHVAGNGIRILQFRGDKELPWITNADNYNFNYQQFRMLIEEKKVLPGDQLGMRCLYNTASRNGITVVGGHSTREEMCVAHLYYYYKRPVPFFPCRSQLLSEEYNNLLGIQNTTWDPTRYRVIVTEPAEYAGLTVSEYANQYIEWDLTMRQEVQRLQLYEPQVTQCPVVDDTPPTWQELQDATETSWNPSLWGVPRYRRLPQCDRLPPGAFRGKKKQNGGERKTPQTTTQSPELLKRPRPEVVEKLWREKEGHHSHIGNRSRPFFESTKWLLERKKDKQLINFTFYT